MSYDDEYDDYDVRVPTMRSVLSDFSAVLLRPVVTRVARARRGWTKVRRFEINWVGFGVTRGGFFDIFGSPRLDRGVNAEEVIVASGGYCAPITATYWNDDGWQPWRRWYPPFDYSVRSSMPVISAPRGGIRMVAFEGLDAAPRSIP